MEKRARLRILLLLGTEERQIKPMRPTKENKGSGDSDLFHRGNNSSFFTWECFEIPPVPPFLPQVSCLREAYLIIWEQQAEAVTNHEQSRTGDQVMTTTLRFMGTGCCYRLSSPSFSRSAIVREIDFPSLSPAPLLTINSNLGRTTFQNGKG